MMTVMNYPGESPRTGINYDNVCDDTKVISNPYRKAISQELTAMVGLEVFVRTACRAGHAEKHQ